MVSAKSKTKTPPTILAATVLIVVCAIALVVFAVTMVYASFHAPDANTASQGGAIQLAAMIFVAACALIFGLCRLFTAGQRVILFVLLGLPLGVGLVGQTIDMLGTASTGSNIIGACILLLFATPIILLLLPSSKKWASSV